MQSVNIIAHNPLIRLGIKYFLIETYNDIRLADFESIEEMKASEVSVNPDLIFIAVSEDKIGMDSLLGAQQAHPESKIIVYDVQDKSHIGVEYLKYGAYGYLARDCERSALKNCVSQVLGGKRYVDPSNLYSLILAFSNDLPAEHKNGKRQKNTSIYNKCARLTDSQRQIANLLAEGMRTSQIAKRLGLKPSTISTVKSTIFTKMQVNNVIDLKDVLGRCR